MSERKVLIVGMVDSIHLARWLGQFIESDIEFHIYPSKIYKTIHPKLRELIVNHPNFKFMGLARTSFIGFYGYLDYILFETIPNNLRVRLLSRLIKQNNFDYIHALEIQGAGYLTDNALRNIANKPRFILTNWGSDIFYFQSIPDHLKKIRNALKAADLYSAECIRDYKLAKLYGFRGTELPCIPNAGGFEESEFNLLKVKTSERNWIVVKTYGGRFGRGDLAIEAISHVLLTNLEVSVFFYSVTDDLVERVSKLKSNYPNRVDFSTLERPLSHERLRDIFLKSRVYIGCSISDGISTSFLEAITYGAYPIQTDTSCANEWVDKGVNASLVPLDLTTIRATLANALTNDVLVDAAFVSNLKVAINQLGSKTISTQAISFYF
jgi:hypothetical protein